MKDFSSYFAKRLVCVIAAFGLMTHAVCAQELPSGAEMTPAVEAQLREVLKQALPAGLADKDVALHYQKLEDATFKLNDRNERERVLREWYRTQPNNLSPRWNLGMLLIEKGSAAPEGFGIMEGIYQDTKEPIAAMRVRIKLAGSFLDYGKYQNAQRMLTEASGLIAEDMKRQRPPEGRYWPVRVQMEFAIAQAQYFQYQGRYGEALKFSQQALSKGVELAASHDRYVSPWLANFSRSNHANAAVSHAMIQMQMGATSDAEESLRSALALFKSYGFTDQHLWHLYRTTADLYFIQGRFQDSLDTANKVKAMVAASGLKENTAQSLWTVNRVIRALAGLERWQDLVAQTDQLDKITANDPALKPIAALTEYRAFAYLQTGRTQAAENWYRGHMNWAVANIGAQAYATGLSRGMYAVALSRNPAKSAQAKTEFENAFKTLADAETLPDVNQEHPFYLKVKKKIYKEYLGFLSRSAKAESADKQEDAKQAFVVANTLISSSVQKAIGEAAARASITQPALGEVARADQDAKSELAFLYQYLNNQSMSGAAADKAQIVADMRKRVQELDTSRKNYKLKIEKEFPDYFQLLQPRTPTSADIAGVLKAREYFLAIVPTEAETYVFGVGPDGGLHFHRSALKQDEVAQIVKRLRTTLDVAGLGTQAPRFRYDDAFRLYQELLAPQASHMAGAQQLIIAASGDLGQIPYAVLVNAPWPQGADKDAPWLIKSHAISQISSAQSWLALRKMPKTVSGQASMIAWGDPSFTLSPANVAAQKAGVRSAVTTRAVRSADLSQPHVDPVTYASLPPLPETREEVLALARLMKSNVATDVLLGDKATRLSVLQSSDSGQLKNKRWVVFATHGLLAGDLPGLSEPALAMASSGSRDESPLLTLQDVLGLRMNADWVILSACNTAGADGKNEEALSGLARGFFYAGAKSLLVTHWSVESESAMVLTTETFKVYGAESQSTRAQSLQLGMLKVMQDARYGHPAYWAPYALVGEGGR